MTFFLKSFKNILFFKFTSLPDESRVYTGNRIGNGTIIIWERPGCLTLKPSEYYATTAQQKGGGGDKCVCVFDSVCECVREKEKQGACVCECVCARGGKSVAAASLPSCWYTMVVVVVAVAVLTTRKQAERGNFIAERYDCSKLTEGRSFVYRILNLKTLKLIKSNNWRFFLLNCSS